MFSKTKHGGVHSHTHSSHNQEQPTHVPPRMDAHSSPAAATQGVGGRAEAYSAGPAKDSSDSASDPMVGTTASEHKMRRASTSDIFRALEQRKVHNYGACQGGMMKIWLYPVNPYGAAHTWWDVFILILVIWSSLWGPYQTAFLPGRSMSAFDWFVDICFYADIILNFWTGYDNGIEIVTDKGMIARRYLGFWFWIDASATIEWDLLITAFTDAVPTQILGLLRLIKIARLARASRLIKRLTQSWTTNTGFIESAKFFVYVLLCGHIMACFFYLFPDLVGDNTDLNVCRLLEDGLDSHVCHKVDDNICESLDIDNDRVLHTDRRATDSDGQMYMWGGERHCPFGLAGTDAFGKPQYVAWDGDTETYCGSFDRAHEDECSWRLQYGLEDPPNLGPASKYIQSMYWSMTTMTTIGYGDRGPSTKAETILCMFCQIIGLSMFALLLTQVNNLNEVLGRERQEKDDIKDDIIGFLKFNLDGDLVQDLISDVIQYLNFKADSIAGFFIEDNDPRFEVLSPELLKATKVALFVPPLKRVKFFGHSKEDADEKLRVQKMFDETDIDGGGALDRDEILGLTKRLGLEFGEAMLDQAMREMDPDGGGQVDFDEFEAWWFTKKNGKPRTPTCPILFIEELAACMRTNAYSGGDKIQPCGKYGNMFNIVLTGTVTIVERDPNHLLGSREHDTIIRTVKQADREPFFGLVAALSDKDRSNLGHTDEWFAKAEGFCDVSYISGHNPKEGELGYPHPGLRQLIRDFWPRRLDEDGNELPEGQAGEKVFYSVARNFYHAIWDEGKPETTQSAPNVLRTASGTPTSVQDSRMLDLSTKVDASLEALKADVGAMVSGLDAKLDLLLAGAS